MKIKTSDLREFITNIVMEVLKEQNMPPPVPRAVAGASRLQALANNPSSNINNILQKRKMGQPLTPQEKRAYLDHVAQQNATGNAQAAARRDTEMSAVEKNPERFTNKQN